MGYTGSGSAFLNPGGGWGSTAGMGGQSGGMGTMGGGSTDDALIPRGNPSNFFGAQWQNLGPSGQGAAMFGGAMGLMSMLGRRQGPSRYEVEQEGIGRGLMGASDAYSGQLGSLGMNLQNRGMQNMDMYRDRYMDAMMDPNNQIYDMGQLAAADTNRMRGISQRVGLMGGGLKAGQLNAAGYNPGVGSGIAGILSAGRQRQGAAFGQGAQWGQSDFNQGLGLGQQAFGVLNQGRQGFMGNLRSLQAAGDARRAASNASTMSAVKGIGSMAGGGFG